MKTTHSSALLAADNYFFIRNIFVFFNLLVLCMSDLVDKFCRKCNNSSVTYLKNAKNWEFCAHFHDEIDEKKCT